MAFQNFDHALQTAALYAYKMSAAAFNCCNTN